MKYPKEYLDEIKTRLKVSTVVSKYVSLKKRGKEYVGLSPFKNEKTPSFTVNDEKEFYHCFATSEHGNIFDFVMKTQNLRFGEAVKMLSNLAGMQPYTFSKQDEEREKNWKEYKSIYSKYVENINIVPVYGGANMDTQIRSLKKGAHIVIGTPGRTKDMIRRKKLNLNNVQTLNGRVEEVNDKHDIIVCRAVTSIPNIINWTKKCTKKGTVILLLKGGDVEKELKNNKSKRKILLTIDDGFLSFYKNAWPILKEKKIPFILFVSTREVGAFNYMTWDQIREISKEDFVEIGNHSHTHEYLVDENKDVIISDIKNKELKIFGMEKY